MSPRNAGSAANASRMTTTAAHSVLADLVVDRRAFDRIIASGGFITANTGGAPDGNAIPVPKVASDSAMDAAACIGCGACVAACPNGSASLFTAAKVTHLGVLPQGQAERYRRALSMVRRNGPGSIQFARSRWC